MSYKDKLDKCLVSLDIGDANALFIVLASDGTICRRGNGATHTHLPMLKGSSSLEYFRAFMTTVEEQWFAYSGLIEQHPIAGELCKLMIVFSGPDGEEAGFKCLYGTESQGPPAEIAQMLITAVKLTDSWYQTEQENLQNGTISESDSAKKWWRFWG